MQVDSSRVTVHKTRAQVYRDRVDIRLATDEAGPLIAAILKENGIELPGVDWSKVFPHWLIACDGGDVIGCVQVMPAVPVAWCEFLLVKKSVPFKLKAISVRKLIQQAMATAFHAGSQLLAATVRTDNKAFLGVLEHMNCTAVGDVKLIVKRLT